MTEKEEGNDAEQEQEEVGEAAHWQSCSSGAQKDVSGCDGSIFQEAKKSSLSKAQCNEDNNEQQMKNRKRRAKRRTRMRKMMRKMKMRRRKLMRMMSHKQRKSVEIGQEFGDNRRRMEEEDRHRKSKEKRRKRTTRWTAKTSKSLEREPAWE